ncbi:hypothetical protein [Bradyrhizobium liaoningense]
MAQQLHHSPYGMIVIARMGSMKFLPNVNMRAQNRAARKLRAILCANLQPNRRQASVQANADAGENWFFALAVSLRRRSAHESIRSPNHHVRAAHGGPRSHLERAGDALTGTGRSAGAVLLSG